jgi:hypothetical protein
MGGYGSGWQRSRKTTVEDCLVLSMATFVRRKALVPGACTRGGWGWWREGEKDPFARLGYEVDASDPAHAWLRLDYRVNGTPADYRIRLMTSQPTYGGHRWWFVCPLVRRDGGSPRRVAKLYLPPGERYFGSRAGYGLTYTSCQESGQFRGLFRHLAAEMGTDEMAVRAALSNGWRP